MKDFSAIKDIHIHWKGQECQMWSDKLLAKARRQNFSNVLLGKGKIPKTDEDNTKDSEEGKMSRIPADINELAYTELILSIDNKTIYGKVA
jgi:hypothetical protein